MTKSKYKCRISENAPMPCNWNKDGICGADAKPCKFEEKQQ